MNLEKYKTLYSLGLINLIRVGLYRLSIKSGLIMLFSPKEKAIIGPFFDIEPTGGIKNKTVPNSTWVKGVSDCFGWLREEIENPPNWHKSVINGKSDNNTTEHWTLISDFTSDIGDIKGVWELSRFDWLIAFCRQYLHTGDEKWLRKMNEWLLDWNHFNPGNVGPNWKCGQEVSIRVIRLATVKLLTGASFKMTPSLKKMVESHLRRIELTLYYAIGQDNNHGTTEAAALFIGGDWLCKNGGTQRAKLWRKKGLYWLENRITRLIENDGTFSQYSLNYHRFMLDTLSLAETWRSTENLPHFSNSFYKHTKAATHWLRSMTNAKTGDVPNIGANDGGRVLILDDNDYRDFRSSVQLATILFMGKRAFPKYGSYDSAINALGITAKESLPPLPKKEVFDDGGFAILTTEKSKVFFRYPRFHFRPSHSDLLHLDFWLDGQNILADSGTFSYNCKPKLLNYFSGVKSHNTIQFDGRDQMPRLSRFLFGAWPTADCDGTIKDTSDGLSFSVGYCDCLGATHYRSLLLRKGELLIIDKISGFKEDAVLRWHLAAKEWKYSKNGVYDKNISIKVTAEQQELQMNKTTGWQSRYYSQKTEVPIIEFKIKKARPKDLQTEEASLLANCKSTSKGCAIEEASLLAIKPTCGIKKEDIITTQITWDE